MVSLRELLVRARGRASDAAVELHSELTCRLADQSRLAAAVAARSRLSAAASPARTLEMMVSGIGRDLASLDRLCAKLPRERSLLDAYHGELRKIEARSSLTLTSVVDVLREMRDADARLDLLEVLIRAHVGSALLLRNHLVAHAAHLENLPSVRERLRRGTTDDDYSGAAREALPLRTVVVDAGRQAALLAEHAGLEEVPPLDLVGFESEPSAACVPHHVSHVLLELLKNAFNAHLVAGRAHAPVVVRHRRLAVGHPAVCLDIIDSGVGVAGGVPAFRRLAKLRPGKRYDRIDNQTSYAAVPDPLSGIGVGLCVARVHAEHFDGGGVLLASDGPDAGATATLVLANDLDASERSYSEDISQHRPAHDDTVHDRGPAEEAASTGACASSR